MILPILFSLLTFWTAVPAYAQHKLSVIVPLYIYPSTSTTWAPLESAISQFPDLQFYVIINPQSGPGAPNSQPDTNYQAAVAALRTHANVLLVGYVYTLQGQRALADVEQDIATYAGWATAYSLAGIFFDQTEKGLTTTYTAYTAAARNAAWPGRTSGYVILNPGVDIGDSDYYGIADQIVTFEGNYTSYLAKPLPAPHPTQQSVIIHTFNGTFLDLESLVLHPVLGQGFESVYVTNVVYDPNGNTYGAFGTGVTAIDQLAMDIHGAQTPTSG